MKGQVWTTGKDSRHVNNSEATWHTEAFFFLSPTMPRLTFDIYQWLRSEARISLRSTDYLLNYQIKPTDYPGSDVVF